MRLNDEERECIQVLRTSEYEQFKDRNPNRLEGTCQWVLRHENFQNWKNADTSSLLWISADPGSGKSVLSKSLIDKELKSTDAQTTCYFFFKDDHEAQKSVSVALSALLHQLFSAKPELVEHAMADYKVDGKTLLQLFQKLWNILIKATADPDAGKVICVLDALDECAETGRYQIISAVKAFERETSSSNISSQLKFLLTSRPYFDIERRFADLVHDLPTIRLHGENESEAISSEIDIVIKSKVLELGTELVLDDSEQLTLQNELLSMTHRTYLWLKLIVEVIRDEISLTKKRIKHIVSTLPATVDQAYEAILSRVKNKDKKKAQKLLHLVLIAVRPLTLGEMNIALAIEDLHRSREDLDLENEGRFRSAIRNLCGLFVSVVDRKIYLIHQTAREFLLAKGEALSGRWKYSLDSVESNLVMAKACVAYLNFDVFEWRAFASDHEFLNYAACFWVTHFQQAQSRTTTELSQSVLQICDPRSTRFRNWWTVCVLPLNEVRSDAVLFADSLMVQSYFGLEVTAKLLFESDNVDVHARNMLGQTSLLLAAGNGHKAVIQLLLEMGHLDVNAEDNTGCTAQSRAIENKHEATAHLLLETGDVNINATFSNGSTALNTVAYNGQDSLAQVLLVSDQIDVNVQDVDGTTALLYAAQRGHEGIVKLLLQTGRVDVNLQDMYDRTALLYAAERGHTAIVQVLLNSGRVDLNIQDIYGRTGLLYAAELGHEALVQLLLRTGRVDINLRDTYGQSALSYAAQQGHVGIVQLLLKSGRVDINSQDEDGHTPLSYAAQKGYEAIVQLLLETGQVSINLRDTRGRTPLLYAAIHGYPGIMQLLLKTGQAEMNVIDAFGHTSLSYAVMIGHKAILQILYERGQVND